jgi:hypothetical protein
MQIMKCASNATTIARLSKVVDNGEEVERVNPPRLWKKVAGEDVDIVK